MTSREELKQQFSYHPFVAAPVAECIQLNFSDLEEFESVQDHYQSLGIYFEGAIALKPSNPAFATDPETLVVTPETGQSSIAVRFRSLQKMVGARVTASQQIKLTLFNQDDQLIAEQWAGAPQYLQSLTPEQNFPDHQLEVLAESIAKVEFSSDAPFIVHSFSCG